MEVNQNNFVRALPANGRAPPLCFIAIGMDGMHYKGALYAHGATIATVYPLNFAGDEAIANVIQASCPIFFWQGDAEQTHLAHFIEDGAIKGFVPIGF